jgi:hypothetical protein
MWWIKYVADAVRSQALGGVAEENGWAVALFPCPFLLLILFRETAGGRSWMIGSGKTIKTIGPVNRP